MNNYRLHVTVGRWWAKTKQFESFDSALAYMNRMYQIYGAKFTGWAGGQGT